MPSPAALHHKAVMTARREQAAATHATPGELQMSMEREAQHKKERLERASQEVWGAIREVTGKLVEKGVQPDEEILGAAALADYGQLISRFHMSDPGNLPGTRGRLRGIPGVVRDKFAHKHKIGGWDLKASIKKPGAQVGDSVSLGEDGALYIGQNMTQRDHRRGVIVPIRVMQSGTMFASEEQCEQMLDGLLKLAQDTGIEWPIRAREGETAITLPASEDTRELTDLIHIDPSGEAHPVVPPDEMS